MRTSDEKRHHQKSPHRVASKFDIQFRYRYRYSKYIRWKMSMFDAFLFNKNNNDN
jgi:hypothetical protein